MLSMMLGVEGEDGTILQFLKFFPHVYEYYLQCVFTFVTSISFNFFFVLSHGPNPCFTSSSPPSIPRCPIAASSSRIFSFNFQNRTYTKTLLHYEVHEFSFPTSPYSPKIDSEQESYVHFIPALQSVPTNFRTRNIQCSSIPPCTGLQIY